MGLRALHGLRCRHAEQLKAAGEHLLHRPGQSETGKLEGLVFDQHAFGVVPAVEFGRQVLQVESYLVRRMIGGGILDQLRETAQTGAEGELTLVVEQRKLGR